MAREYILWPGAQSFPGKATFPNSYPRVDDDVTEVHSKLGSVWERVTDEESKKLAEAAAAHINSSEQIGANTSFPITLDRIAPSATLAQADTAVIREIWSRVVNAEEGTFLKIKAGMIAANAITADNIQVGAIDGQVITGALIRSAASGARIEFTSEYFRAIDSSGRTRVNINPRNGRVELNGDLGIADSWSRTAFTDIKWADSNGADVSPAGLWGGTGLMFKPTDESIAVDGALTITRRGDPGSGKLYLSLYAPARTGGASYLYFGQSDYKLYLQDTDNTRMLLDGNHFWAGSDKYFWALSNSGIYYGGTNIGRIILNGSGGTFWSSDKVGLQFSYTNGTYLSWGDHWIGITSSSCVMSWNTDKQAVTNATWGISQRGGKNFIMRVPGRTDVPGGKELIHSCTESPYDGIEYWGAELVPDSGELTVGLPDYVPLIHNREAPHTLQVTPSTGTATAQLELGETEYRLHIQATPGAQVNWLVKMARLMDRTGEDGRIELYGRDHWKDPWIEPIVIEPEVPAIPELPEPEMSGIS